MLKKHVFVFGVAIVLLLFMTACSKQPKTEILKKEMTPTKPSQKFFSASSVEDCKKILPSPAKYCAVLGQAKAVYIARGQTIQLDPMTTMSYQGPGSGSCQWLTRSSGDNSGPLTEEEQKSLKSLSFSIELFPDDASAKKQFEEYAKTLNNPTASSEFAYETAATDAYKFNSRTVFSTAANIVTSIMQFSAKDTPYYCGPEEVKGLLNSLKG